MATTSKSSLVPPRYHCPTIGLIAFILTASHCCARLHSTTNESFAQYVYFARSNIASARNPRQIFRRLFRRRRSHIADTPVRGFDAGCEPRLQEKNGRQIGRDRLADMRAVRAGGCAIP